MQSLEGLKRTNTNFLREGIQGLNVILAQVALPL